jgi:lipopolysaccharide export system permease protein
MKANSIINRYIIKEMVPPFMITLTFFSFVFLMTQILEITRLVVNFNISIVSIGLMLAYSMPFFLAFIIPMSVMMAVLLTFLRLSSDNEITALKAAGVSIYRLLPPVLIFGLVAGLLTAFMTIVGLPKGRLALKRLVYDVAVSNLDIGLKARTFNDSFKGVMLYVNRIDQRSKELQDIFIEDQRSQGVVTTVVAPQGKLFSDPEALAFQLRLFNGTINQVDLLNRSAHAIRFNIYDVNLDLSRRITPEDEGPKDEEEMGLGELRTYLRTRSQKDARYYLALMEWHKKFSLPAACLALGILAVPLGIKSHASRKSFGVGLGLVFFLLYYILLSVGWVFGEAGVYPPFIGMWLPNVVMGGIGVFLLTRTVQERPAAPEFLRRRLRRKGRRNLKSRT